MIELIKENKFNQIKEDYSKSDFRIHELFVEVLNDISSEEENFNFKADRYQEEFIEGFKIYETMLQSDLPEHKSIEFLTILVFLGFKTGEFIQLLSHTAMNKGVYLTDLPIYKFNPLLRTSMQSFYDLLDKKGYESPKANIAAAKTRISQALINVIPKYEFANDMLQFAKSYEEVNQTEMAVNIYRGIMNDFECDSVKSSSGILPEISQVDTRPQEEILVFEKAKENLERLTCQKIQEPKRTHIDSDENAKKLVVENSIQEKEATQEENVSEENESSGFFNRIMNLFKKN